MIIHYKETLLCMKGTQHFSWETWQNLFTSAQVTVYLRWFRILQNYSSLEYSQYGRVWPSEIPWCSLRYKPYRSGLHTTWLSMASPLHGSGGEAKGGHGGQGGGLGEEQVLGGEEDGWEERERGTSRGHNYQQICAQPLSWYWWAQQSGVIGRQGWLRPH